MGILEPGGDGREQYLIVYGPPKAPPTVYDTAYRKPDAEDVRKRCHGRYAHGHEDVSVRIVRGCDLDVGSVAKQGGEDVAL